MGSLFGADYLKSGQPPKLSKNPQPSHPCSWGLSLRRTSQWKQTFIKQKLAQAASCVRMAASSLSSCNCCASSSVFRLSRRACHTAHSKFRQFESHHCSHVACSISRQPKASKCLQWSKTSFELLWSHLILENSAQLKVPPSLRQKNPLPEETCVSSRTTLITTHDAKGRPLNYKRVWRFTSAPNCEMFLKSC